MSNPENAASSKPDPEFDLCVEQAILKYQQEHPGQIPGRRWVAAEVKASNSRVCPAMRRVLDRMAAVQTRLGAMAEIPEELKLTGDQFVKSLWSNAKDLANAEVADLRRSQDAKDIDHRWQLQDAEETIFAVEKERDEARAEAEALGNRVEEFQKELATLREELEKERARALEPRRAHPAGVSPTVKRGPNPEQS